jgi:cytochrome c oxidase subunit 1
MPRRYYDYLPEFFLGHFLSTIGSWILVAGFIYMMVNLLKGLFSKEKVSANPWGASTLEWTIPSPPPLENFEVIPTITHGPYKFAKEQVNE